MKDYILQLALNQWVKSNYTVSLNNFGNVKARGFFKVKSIAFHWVLQIQLYRQCCDYTSEWFSVICLCFLKLWSLLQKWKCFLILGTRIF